MKYILLHADFTSDIPTCTVQCPCSRVEHIAFYGWDALNCRDCGKDIQRFPPMSQESIKKVCYMCEDDIDPNETPFDEDIHMLCILCARKMEEIQENYLL